uniref:NADH-ubiquinone oxidoreductase chain 4L n=2 Tax=Pachybrachis TaxID=131689 RepID=A0A3G1GSF5_9CUCU|nr:NADH dehydrogenase subunit 4L [Pachybrachis sp. ReAss_150]APX40703.1 NADH dehydrogenase subunit 4L [Pachybrachis suffrianii]
MYFSLFLMSVFSGLLSFSLFRKHLLLMLLSLEFLVIALYFGLFMTLGNYSYEYFFSLIFLVMSVCEGALGLSILVMMIRSSGNDYILTLNSLW